MNIEQLTMLIPRLRAQLSAEKLTHLPSLAWLLQHSQHAALPEETDILDTFFSSSSLAFALAQTLGVANPQMQWYILEPMHLSLDAHHAFLTRLLTKEINTAEASALTDILTAIIAVYEGKLYFYQKLKIWLLALPDNSIKITTSRPGFALNKSIMELLPQPLNHRFNQLLTEIQLALYQHSINQQREQNNQLTISGFWGWGTGENQIAVSKFDCLITHNDLYAVAASGLVYRHSLQLSLLEGQINRALYLDLEFENSNDNEALHLQELEKTCILVKQLIKRNKIKNLTIYLDYEQQINVNKSTIKKWWQRTPTYKEILHG